MKFSYIWYLVKKTMNNDVKLSQNADSRPIQQAGIKWALVGLVILLVGLLIAYLNEPYIDFHGTTHRPSELLNFVVELAKILGGTLIAVGFINILIETNDWSKYFQKRLK